MKTLRTDVELRINLFQCWSAACIDRRLVCDGTKDCVSGAEGNTDETGCG